MPIRARRACAQPGCPNLQPCLTHTRRSWQGRPSARTRGYTAEYERTRKLVLSEETHCGLCGGPGLEDDEVDHRVPLSRGGTNERANLRRAHRECNQARARNAGAITRKAAHA